MYKTLLENLQSRIGQVETRRYSLSDIISESYKSLYACEKGTNLYRLVESHICEVRNNPNDIERLSEQLCTIKKLISMYESNSINDEELCDEECVQKTDDKFSRRMKECDKTPRRKKKELLDNEDELNEADEELTDEEVEQLSKYLDDMRKGKKPTTNNTNPVPKVTESKKVNKSHDNLNERMYNIINRYSITDIIDKLTDLLEYMESNGLDHIGGLESNTYGLRYFISFPSAGFLDLDDIEKYVNSESDDEYESKEIKGNKIRESYNRKALKNFNTRSKDKAFTKTFRKLSKKLHEGTALTRQETINLYKAANSAMTHLSVELEHNPEFLSTFKESTSILSKDVNHILESMKNDKAPSKKTMKSLAKFSDTILTESNTPDENKMEKIVSFAPTTDIAGKDFTDTLTELVHAIGAEDSSVEKNANNYTITIKYPNEEILHDTLIQIENCGFFDHWIEEVNESENDDDLDTEESPDEAIPPIEDDEEDVVGTEVEEEPEEELSPEAEDYYQDYADARKELHDEMEEKHGDPENPENVDPQVEQALEQDADEVAILTGEDEEEEASEETPDEEIPPIEDEEVSVDEETPDDELDDEISEDELEELKKHLTEMRKMKRK